MIRTQNKIHPKKKKKKLLIKIITIQINYYKIKQKEPILLKKKSQLKIKIILISRIKILIAKNLIIPVKTTKK